MIITEEIVQKYKKQIARLSSETLFVIVNDYQKALIAAQKGIMQMEPEKIKDSEYLKIVAKNAQIVAKQILKSREKL